MNFTCEKLLRTAKHRWADPYSAQRKTRCNTKCWWSTGRTWQIVGVKAEDLPFLRPVVFKLATSTTVLHSAKAPQSPLKKLHSKILIGKTKFAHTRAVVVYVAKVVSPDVRPSSVKFKGMPLLLIQSMYQTNQDLKEIATHRERGQRD